MARTYAAVSQKGGAGKTTLAANLGCAFGKLGDRVLLVDLDYQFDLSRSFGVAPSEAPASTVDLILEGTRVADARIEDVAPNVDLIVGDKDLGGVEKALADPDLVAPESLLKEALKGQTRDYDVVIIDCRPDRSRLVVNAIFAADEILAPIPASDRNALAGARNTQASIHAMRERKLIKGRFRGILNHVDQRNATYKELKLDADDLKIPLTRTIIPRSQDVPNSLYREEPIVVGGGESETGKRVVAAYMKLARELTNGKAA